MLNSNHTHKQTNTHTKTVTTQKLKLMFDIKIPLKYITQNASIKILHTGEKVKVLRAFLHFKKIRRCKKKSNGKTFVMRKRESQILE